MDTSTSAWLAALAGGGLALAAFACERSVRLFPWSRVEEVEDRPRRQRMEYSLEHSSAVATVCITAGALASVIMTGGVFVLMGLGRSPTTPVWSPLGVSLSAVALVSWIVPSLIARSRPEAFVAFWVPHVGRLVTIPFARNGGNGGNGNAEEVRPEEDEDTEEEAREVYRSLLRLPKVTASEIMTPRINMVFVRDSATVQDVLEAARHSGHSRLPVFHETRDQIVGILYIKDLLSRLGEPDWKASSIRDLLRKPLFVPETKNVDDLMEEFQRGKVHLGIVLDEYGGTAGLITIEDIIEELIGEIRDEHDPEEASLFYQVDEKAYELGATVRVDEVNDFLNVNLPEDEDFDTVGGYVAFALGRLPSNGETFERDGVRITVLEADARRVKRVRIENLNGRP